MKPIVTIGRGVVIERAPRALLNKCVKDLTFANPEYVNAMKYGSYSSPNMPATIELYEMEDDNIWIPKGYIHPVMKFFKQKKIKPIIRDESRTFDPIKFQFTAKLRDYQKKAIPDLKSYPVGVLEADTGAGKTVMGLYMIVVRKQPTLIIVHSKELLYQWKDRIETFLGIDCGLIGDSKCKIKPVTVGIINSVKNRVDTLHKHFGHIICDECHRVSADTWAGTIQNFDAKYLLGLTATPFRQDGLGKAIFCCVGPLRHTVDREELNRVGAVLKPEIFRVKTGFQARSRLGEELTYTELLTKLTNDEKRNAYIAKGIDLDLQKYNENILLVSDRQKQLKIVQEMLSNRGIKCNVLISSVNSKDRKKMVEELRNGTCKVLAATGSLIGEGFDAPELSALFMGTPIKSKGRLRQICGRVLRPKKGKVARIYDLRDEDIPAFLYSGFARDKVYKSLGW